MWVGSLVAVIDKFFGFGVKSSSYAGNTKLRKIGILSLPENGYSEWERDFSQQLVAEAAPAKGTVWPAEQDIDLQFKVGATDEYVNYRSSSSPESSYVVKYIAASGNVYLQRQNPGESVVTLISGVSAAASGDTIRVWCDGDTHHLAAAEALVGSVVDSGNSVSGANVAYSDISGGNVTDLYVHPHPALGPATNRTIYPQIDEEQSMDPDSFILWKTVSLPPAGEYRDFCVRCTDTLNTLIVRIKSDGSALLRSIVGGTAYDRISFGAGSHTDGGDIMLWLRADEARMWVGGSLLTQTGVTPTSGSIAKTKAIYGDRFPCGECAIWPVDLVGKKLIPRELS